MQTNDLQVLKVLSQKTGQSSARVAERLGLTPFQITARLASMEKRGLAKRTPEKNWVRLLSVEDAKQMEEKMKRTSTGNRHTIAVDSDEAALRRDSKAPVVRHVKGWTFRYFWMSGDNRVIVFTTPDGKHYTYAEPSEEATLLVDYRERNIGMVRLREFNKQSITYRRLRKERGQELDQLGFTE